MKAKILKALAKFDVEKEAYWTEEGLPVLEAIQHYAKDASITRAMVTATAPGFSRSNPSLEVGVVEAETTPIEPPPIEPVTQPVDAVPTPEATVEEADAPQGQTKTEVEAASQSEPNVVTEATQPKTEEPKLTEAEVKEAEEILEADGKVDGLRSREKQALREKYEIQQKTVADEIAEVVAARGKLETELNRLYIAEESISDKIIKLVDVNRQTHALKGYFAGQQKIRDERGKNLKRIQEADIDLKALLPQRSALDLSMKRNTKRGMKRPQPRALL